MIMEWNAPVPPLSPLKEDNKKIKEIAPRFLEIITKNG